MGKVLEALLLLHYVQKMIGWACLTWGYTPISREAESEKASLVVQGMLMKFDCRFLKRMIWCISFDIWLCPNVVHSYGIHGNS